MTAMLRTALTLVLILLFLPCLAPAEEFDLTFRPLPDGSLGRDLFVPTRDGLFVYGYVRKLAGNGPFPGVILVHGGLGGTWRGSRGLATNTSVADALIREGYAVLGMDYRGGDWLTEADDVIAGYEFFRKLPYVKDDAVAMIGGSHGAKLTLEIVTRIDLQAAVYCAGFHSLSDILEHVQGKGAKVFSTPTPSGRQRPGRQAVTEITEQLGGTPEQKPQAWAEQDLVPRLGNVNTPLLLVHGSQDALCPFEFSQEVVAELRSLGKPFETYFPDNGPHGFYWGINAQLGGDEIYRQAETDAFVTRTITFLNQRLK